MTILCELEMQKPSKAGRFTRHRPALHRPAQRRPRKQARGIERRQRGIRVVHDQRNLGAAEYDSVAALIFHPSDDPLKGSDRLGLEDAVNQLIHDDAIDFFAFGGVRAHILQVRAL